MSCKKPIIGSALAEYLAQQLIEDYPTLQPEFPNEDIMALFVTSKSSDDERKWILFFDGSSNALGHGIGGMLIFLEKQYIPMTGRLCFDCTNTIAEYEVCALGIRAAIKFKVVCLNVYGDSTLVVHQIKGKL